MDKSILSQVKNLSSDQQQELLALLEELEEAKSSGIMNRRYIDEINNEFVSDTWLKGINPDKLLQSGIGDKPWKALKVGANEVQGFDVEQFAKNLGLGSVSRLLTRTADTQ